MMDQPVFQVSEFAEFITTYLNQIGSVVVEGEISQLRVSQQKWLFLTIKDDQSSVEVFGTVYQIPGWKQLEEGMLVRVTGSARLYKKTGRFSLFATDIQPAGEGALRIAFEKVKKQLEAEGLFDQARKRTLPRFPQHLGLITAKGSQAYNDFVKVLGARMGGIHISFYPVSVQGADAVSSIVSTFSAIATQDSKPDVLILVRGGGSLEDLISFNDERVVRAIFASQIPVVVGVGHEGDISLSDLVADLRASTPSNAAELLVEERAVVLAHVRGSIKSIERILAHQLVSDQQRVYLAGDVLQRAVANQLKSFHTVMRAFSSQFDIYVHQVTKKSFLYETMADSLSKNVRFWLHQEQQRLEGLTRLLASLDYRRVLARGYSITRNQHGQLVRSVHDAPRGQDIETMVGDGTIRSTITYL